MRFIWFLLICILFISCQGSADKSTIGNNVDTTYFIRIAAFDTITIKEEMVENEGELNNLSDVKSLEYHYFKGRHYKLKEETDSAIFHFNEMKPSPEQIEWQVLKDYQLANLDVFKNQVVEFDKVSAIIKQINFAEKNESRFTYLLYDLLAKTYYQNKNNVKAKEFAIKYYESHPFKRQSKIKKKNIKGTFLLAVRTEDLQEMKNAFEALREIAVSENDTVNLYESYNYESQYLAMTGKYSAALVLNKKYFDYLAKTNQLSLYHFNNLANTNIRNNEIDTAIVYFKKALDWAKEYDTVSRIDPIYNGLTEAYRIKKDYKNAYDYLLKAFNIHSENDEKIKDLQIEELNKKFETEKKDIAIKDLEEKDKLNNTKIVQQGFLFLAILFLVLSSIIITYILRKRKDILKQNELLNLENKRLVLEQKVRQNQLNPHFIYNAIANLQGLIMSNDKKELANQYLVSFSKLMRDFLEMNRHDFISLMEEIEALENYMRLQQMRYENKFDFSIHFENIEPSEVQIPPMLLQPFIENCIDHGFGNIDYKGQIKLDFREENNKLHILITDNGKGKSQQINKLKKQSLSKIITEERLKLLFGKNAWFTTNFRENNSGFEVSIFIPILHD